MHDYMPYCAIGVFYVIILYSKYNTLIMPKTTHQDLIKLGNMLGANKTFDRGICCGYTLAWVHAILANDEKTFYERLQLIADYKDDFKRLKADINEIRSIVQNGGKPTTEQRKILDIPAFFERVWLHQAPHNYPEAFNGLYLSQLDFTQITPFTQPTSIEQHKQLNILLNHCIVGDQDRLLSYFSTLAPLLKTSPMICPIAVHFADHTIGVKYNSHNDTWIYSDSNDLARFPENENFYLVLNTQELVRNLFAMHKDKIVTLGLSILANEINTAFNRKLQLFADKFPIDTTNVHWADSQNATILYMATFMGNISLVKKALACQANVNQTCNKGETPLFIACANGHTEILKELLKNPGIDINKAQTSGTTPLYIACQNGHIEIVKVLLE